VEQLTLTLRGGHLIELKVLAKKLVIGAGCTIVASFGFLS
jgi:hypothetical protein